MISSQRGYQKLFSYDFLGPTQVIAAQVKNPQTDIARVCTASKQLFKCIMCFFFSKACFKYISHHIHTIRTYKPHQAHIGIQYSSRKQLFTFHLASMILGYVTTEGQWFKANICIWCSLNPDFSQICGAQFITREHRETPRSKGIRTIGENVYAKTICLSGSP